MPLRPARVARGAAGGARARAAALRCSLQARNPPFAPRSSASVCILFTILAMLLFISISS